MDLIIKRSPAVDKSIIGQMFIDGWFSFFTLERVDVAIPLGSYQVQVTVSQRASDGQLWSPDPDHKLPLIVGVPGRTGIRIHAMNEASESDGCIGVGMAVMGVTIRQSRIALTRLMTRLESAPGGDIWLNVEEPVPGTEAKKA